MGRIKPVFYMTKTTFLEEWHNKRVIMGFLLGIALFGYWLSLFFQYALDIGEPVNVLEAFIVVEHHHKSILFLVVGWLLMISDAPFVKKKYISVIMQEQPEKMECSYAAIYYDSGVSICCRHSCCIGICQYIAWILGKYVEQSGLSSGDGYRESVRREI